MSCEKAFGFLTRRHHCRHCGRVICKQCQRDMQGMTAWAQADPLTGAQAGDSDPRRSIPNAIGFGDGRLLRRLSSAASGGGGGGARAGLYDGRAETIKVCRQCASAHYRRTMRRLATSVQEWGFFSPSLLFSFPETSFQSLISVYIVP